THALAHTWIPDPRNIGNELLIVRLKLFVPSGATGYEIVVCRRPKMGQPAHAPDTLRGSVRLLEESPVNRVTCSKMEVKDAH
ncbi:MAG TPA: hypothetical protein VN444_05440, partial [Verrucomicrobiae bacterium]|nr:hypothetical protein [Verrucomicrobiae bacterium]